MLRKIIVKNLSKIIIEQSIQCKWTFCCSYVVRRHSKLSGVARAKRAKREEEEGDRKMARNFCETFRNFTVGRTKQAQVILMFKPPKSGTV
jgi:hypothetical protein